METRCLLLLRPLSSSSNALTLTRTSVAFTTRRHQSTTKRTKKALKIRPDNTFLTPRSGDSHVIFNPPSAAPSVYHTPFKFLPPSDPRRQANLTQHLRSSSLTNPNPNNLPPPVPNQEGTAATKRYNVTREQVDEMRSLRATDPRTWSVLKLAARYDCSALFVMMCCKASAEHRETEKTRLEAIKARWGPIRTGAREERKKRKGLLLKGAL